MRRLAWRGHPELVMHVLAHVAATAHLAASVYDAGYVAFAEAHLGPARERPLGEDAEALGRLVTSHRELSLLQLYAALFEAPSDAAERELDPAAVAHPALVARLRPLGAALEILRCAVALERPSLGRLPPISVDERALARALDSVRPAAPALDDYGLLVVRALRHRGRLMAGEIWVGAPGAGPSAEHVAWQAAHEATLGEVAEGSAGLGEREVEQSALALLERRAAEAGLGAEHARWRAHFADP